MEQQFQLRKAKPEEASAAAALYRAVTGRPGCTWNEYYPTEEDALRDAESGGLYFYESGHTLAAVLSVVPENELDDEPWWTPAEGPVHEIARVAVAPEYQGRSLSEAMLCELFAELKKTDGCTAIRLLAAKVNPAALRTYEKLGFSWRAVCHMYDVDFKAGELLL